MPDQEKEWPSNGDAAAPRSPRLRWPLKGRFKYENTVHCARYFAFWGLCVGEGMGGVWNNGGTTQEGWRTADRKRKLPDSLTRSKRT